MADNADENTPLDAIRKTATCPACGRHFSNPRILEPCEHTVCRGCLNDGGEKRVRCPVCRVPCSGDAANRSMSALVNLISVWPDSDTLVQAAPRPTLSLVRIASSIDSRRLRPSAVIHFPGPPQNLRRWPPGLDAAGEGGGGGDGGLAALLRDTNNQRVWAASQDGQSACPVFKPAVDEPYTISGFCLVRPRGRTDWLVVLSDFYQDCLTVCDHRGQCIQRLLGVARPGALCSDGEAVFAVTANGTEVRAYVFRSVGSLHQMRQRGESWRHPRLRYVRAIAAGAGKVCLADSAANFVFVVDRRCILDGKAGSVAAVGGFACVEQPPIAVAVAELAADGSQQSGGCVFVNSIGANRRNCVAAHDLETGRRLLELPCGFVCSCGCPVCVDTGKDPDVGALDYNAERGELAVARKARSALALVFSLGCLNK